MKILPLLALPLLLGSCGLIQMPARLINQVIAPITASADGDSDDETIRIALMVPAEAAR